MNTHKYPYMSTYASTVTFKCPKLQNKLGNESHLVVRIGERRYHFFELAKCTDIELHQLHTWYTSDRYTDTPPNIYIYFEFGTTLDFIEITENQIEEINGPVFDLMKRRVTSKSRIRLKNRKRKII